jgi:hypothetical protein
VRQVCCYTFDGPDSKDGDIATSMILESALDPQNVGFWSSELDSDELQDRQPV